MATQAGGHGPQPGATPDGGADLYNPGTNPYTDGRRLPTDLTSSTASGYGALSAGPAGYYTNPATSAPTNPYADAALPGSPGAAIAAPGTVPVRTGGDGGIAGAPSPTSADYWDDQGFGRTGGGRS